jgi:hypothetical protein
MRFSAEPTAAELLAEGLFADPRAAVAINDRAGLPGTGDHARVLDISLYGGLSLEILPARGLDIGAVRFLGEPLSWVSPVRDARPVTGPHGTDFVTHFNGGLLATCGLRNIGPAAGGEPMHGDYTFLPAENVRTQAEVTPETVAAVVTGEVRSVALFGASFLVRRRITAAVHAGPGADLTAEITVEDEVENLGRQPAPLHMLYHVNLGAPLVVPGTRVQVDAARTTARDPGPTPDWETFPAPGDELGEAVYEHVQPAADEHGRARASVTSGRRRVEVAWSAATLPRLYQWVFPARGRWALGIEPATAPLFGPDRDTGGGGAPLVGAGQVRRQELVVRIGAPGDQPAAWVTERER